MKKKRIQDLSSKSEKIFFNIFYSSPDPQLIIEGQNFIDCNQSAVEFLGYKNKKKLHKIHPLDISPKLQPCGKTSVEKADLIFKNVKKKAMFDLIGFI